MMLRDCRRATYLAPRLEGDAGYTLNRKRWSVAEAESIEVDRSIAIVERDTSGAEGSAAERAGQSDGGT
jgi:hypothetical protein